MTCGACVSSIESNLKSKPGIQSISVALLAEKAVIKHHPSTWSTQQLISAIDDSGFDATLIESISLSSSTSLLPFSPLIQVPPQLQIQLRVTGMTCASCSATIERQISALHGISKVSVALMAERCMVECLESDWSPQQIQSEIEDLGFEAEVLSVINLALDGSKATNGFNKPIDKLMSETKSVVSVYGLQNSTDCIGKSLFPFAPPQIPLIILFVRFFRF